MLITTMASPSSEDRFKLYKFTKILTLKVAQIIVQSRQGKRITQDCSVGQLLEEPPSSPNSLQWFNLSIPDEPEVNSDTKRVLNGEVIEALANVLCIEISVGTSDGDEMVLELWTVRLIPGCDMSTSSVSTIYYRMSIMLKSTLSISRITPAYKMSRLQNKESYKISHKIYGGQPNTNMLGEKYKTIKVSELHTPIGTILIEVDYRTKMTIIPEHRAKTVESNVVGASGEMIIKNDHFTSESPRKYHNEKKTIDLSKPLTAGAFVDTEKIKELHETLSRQLPPEPPMTWLLAEKDRMDNKVKLLTATEFLLTQGKNPEASTSAPETSSKAIEVPKARDNAGKYTSLMEFPFADGSPITELANFYQECLEARTASEEWAIEESADSATLDRQLKMYEEAVPEFDNMVASMFSNSDNE